MKKQNKDEPINNALAEQLKKLGLINNKKPVPIAQVFLLDLGPVFLMFKKGKKLAICIFFFYSKCTL